ncbi:hypothetical protein DSO57_1001549 [Entomophthora muscae]|uniref:Uncharacterized protein n=1 Tax=Entomophthora muscae TaxID=34485 RepID=A0ACC2RP82_9FUNG|nr:hypothetical protein DSO57_1001549 [Entomophthora muscae]
MSEKTVTAASIEEIVNSIEEKQPNEETQEDIPSEYTGQQEANVKDCQSIELFKYLGELVTRLDKTSSLNDETTDAEDLVALCQKISKELQSITADVLPHISALKGSQQKIVSLIKNNPKLVSKLNPKDQTTKVSSELSPELMSGLWF